MAASMEGHYSRRQFLGGVGAAGVVIALPLPRLRSAERGSVAAALRPAIPKDWARAPLRAEFSDDFSRELGGSRLWHWETFGGVLVFGTTAFGARAGASARIADPSVLRRHGMVVALEAPDARFPVGARMRTADSFAFEAGRRYLLEFDVAGSHTAGAGEALNGTLEASVPGVGASTRVRLASSAGFRPVRLEFTPRVATASAIEFVSCDAPGRGGLLLDSVRLAEAA